MIDGYVGIRFVDKGRALDLASADRDGCDCWGLVRLVHYLESGVLLESYGDISYKELLAVAHRMKAGLDDETWVNVADQPRRRLDIVVMRKLEEVSNAPYHVGIMLSPELMLHTTGITGSHTTRLNHPAVKPKIIAYRRHKDLA